MSRDPEAVLRSISAALPHAPNIAKQRADRALRSIERARQAWGRERCECACNHKRRDPCAKAEGGCLTPCGVGY